MSKDVPVLALADGYYMVPHGKMVAATLWLQQFAMPAREPVPAPAGMALQRWVQPAEAEYLALFRTIGEPWLWFGNLTKTAEELAAMLHNPAIRYYAVHDGQQRVALLELDFSAQGEAEVLYFGVAPGFEGTGLGRWLMDGAQRIVWAEPGMRRMWLHTCNADHPAALPFYRKMGFHPYASGIEIGDDPRLTGIYPRTAGPRNVPVIG